MDDAIIRGSNGRRHEFDFGDEPIRVDIYSSEETIEIFIEAGFETLPKGASALCVSQYSPSPFQRSRRRSRATGREPSSCNVHVMSRFRHQRWSAASALWFPKADGCLGTNPTPFSNGTPDFMDRFLCP
jgi:hypothetical protein